MPMFATTDGTKLYYEDAGTGPAPVFRHGHHFPHRAIRTDADLAMPPVLKGCGND